MSSRLVIIAYMCMLAVGCTSMRSTDTARTAKEQLLISNAVDQALNKVPFADLAGQKVFLDPQFLDSVDKGYILGSMRDRILTSGANLADKAEDADIVMEVRSGGVGTDTSETFVGMPKIALPGPIPFQLPEVKLWSKDTQTGVAKLGVVAIDAKSKQLLGRSGKVLAKSDDTGYTVFGYGPYYRGNIREEVRVATKDDKTSIFPSVANEYTASRNGVVGGRVARSPAPAEEQPAVR